MFNRHFGIIIALAIIFIPIGGRTIVDYLLTPSLDFAYRLFLGI
jgi:hypothetical protein